MANTLKFIKSVNHVDTANNLQLLYQFILGSKNPKKHNKGLEYKDGEFVYSYISSEKEFHVFMATKDVPIYTNINDTEYWQRISLKDLLTDGLISIGKSSDTIMISENKPTAQNNNVWLKPIQYKTFNPNIAEDSSNINLIFDCEHIFAQDDLPTDPNVRLWFDYEPDDEDVLSEVEFEEDFPSIILLGNDDDDYSDFQ